MLSLRIANFDRLPDGGPIEFKVDKRGFDLGRAQHLDWTLPDPTRYISSKHCEVRYSEGAYWLHDVSTNGTFVNRSARRVQSPYRLAHGDQLEIGDYLISVSVEGERAASASASAEPPEEPASAGDLWDEPADAPPPVDARDFLAPLQKGSRAADFLNRVVEMPQPAERSNPPGPEVPSEPPSQPLNPAPPPPAARDPWAPTGFERPAPPPPNPSPEAPLATGQVPFASGGRNHAESARSEPGPQAPPAAAPAAAAAPQTDRQVMEREFLRQFARGANLPQDTFLENNPDEFAYELGVLLRLISANLMQLLNARAAAKTLARSSTRTMIQHTDNNPLKFMPSAEEALRVMLSGNASSYLDGRQAFERGFGDLQTHQMATFAAMQQALKELLEDLDPETIGKSASESRPSLLGLNKVKLWDAYTARWEAKAGKHEHGMIDAFLMLFAEFYDRFSRASGAEAVAGVAAPGRRIVALVGAIALLAGAAPAAADFKVCNQTLNLFNLAVGYEVGPDLFETEGWWTLPANSCVSPIKGPLNSKYIYVYGTDVYGEEAVVGYPAEVGTAEMCVDDTRFDIPDSRRDCWVRGYRAVKFHEVDTRNASTWTMFIREN